MEKYQIQRPSGDGTFGQVFKAINKQTGEQVAIKNMKRKFQNWDECVNLREVKALRKLIHPNIVRLKEVVKSNDELNLVFDYFDSNIYQLYMSYRKKKQQMPENLIRQIAKQILEGLAYMHQNGFFHRDLKPENLMWSNNQVKIIDFGLTREIRSRPPFTDYVSTRWYRAPELLVRSTTYNSPVDIFAFGCILAELYNLNPIFCGNSEFDQLTKIFQIMGTPSQEKWGEGYKLASKLRITFPHYEKKNLPQVIPKMSPEGINLLEQIFQYDSTKRPTAQQLLQHPYFTNFDYETGQRLNNYENKNDINHLPSEIYQLEQNMINKIGEMRFSNPQIQNLNQNQNINQNQNQNQFDQNKQISQNITSNNIQVSNAFKIRKNFNQEENFNTNKAQLVKNVQDIEQFQNNQFINNNHNKFNSNQFNYVKANNIFQDVGHNYLGKEYQKVNNLKEPQQNTNPHFNANAYNIINNNNNIQNIGGLDHKSYRYGNIY
ncbi:Protein kinase-like domain [Pseudocohnilembus persalinus]|uniref:Protein kinase-like domain n=1 Tax=Pseudocohnilembus persalinus TaxID=266149 RepID=A0A0V0QZ32_PSEPJ|nr:Protein kinase-like domain [Pseudocohnilembus persalinus]|eukprot:KRX07583.1 Protein kinase-like domain [Pseudocohnilembus persalinus]